MYYSTKTGDRQETPPISGSDEWVVLPEDYQWQTWTFDTSAYRMKTAEEIQYEDTFSKNQKIAEAWNAANTFAEDQFDKNSRISLLWLSMDPNCPQSRRDKILEIQSWWASVWTHYAQQKAKILNGEDVTFDPQVVGNCPYTIWDISQ